MAETNNYETILIGALLTSPELISATALDAKESCDDRLRTIYEIMKFLDESHMDINPATICQELENKEWTNLDAVRLVGILISLFPDDKPDLDTIDSYSKKVHEDYHCLLYTSDAADDLLCVDLGGRR